MKKMVQIFLSLLTATLVVASGALPHHHHEGNAICFDHIECHDNPNDNPSNHENPSDGSGSCPLEYKLEASLGHTSEHSHRCSLCDHHHHHHDHLTTLTPLLAYLNTPVNAPQAVICGSWAYNEVGESFSILYLFEGRPLRAPPVA